MAEKCILQAVTGRQVLAAAICMFLSKRVTIGKLRTTWVQSSILNGGILNLQSLRMDENFILPQKEKGGKEDQTSG